MSQGGEEALPSCIICCNFYVDTCGPPLDRRPAIICNNGHCVCMACANQLKSREDPCPSCRSDILSTPIVNRPLLDAIELLAKRIMDVPEIAFQDLEVAPQPFASGGYADVYHAKWHSQDVVVKALRRVPELNDQFKLMAMEANLAIGLHHPNIVRVFGTTTYTGNRLAIVMEKADHGSLEKHMKGMDRPLAVNVCLGVVDGLDYVHSRRVAHRDIKPQNILLCGSPMVAKIGDFGVSKVIQTLMTNSAMIGTPKYAAPELMEEGCCYGFSVDVYSLSIVVYELFSGKMAEESLGSTVLQILMAVSKGRRPAIPSDFPEVLKPLVSRGWDQDQVKRPLLAEFRTALRSLATSSPASKPVAGRDVRVSMQQQSAEVSKVNLPVPMIALKWDTSFEVLNSKELRKQMVVDIGKKSNMAKIINASVLCAMEVIPRHCFINKERLGRAPSEQDIVNNSYLYNKPIPATPNSNESSPEIIGTQLSLTEITQGQSVLLVGIKGGYIQSLIAQLVGIHGRVVTVTSDATALTICQDRVRFYCPLKSIVSFIQVDNVKDERSIVTVLQAKSLLFHTVIYTGYVDKFPQGLCSVLHPIGNASIMAPVKEAPNSDALRFQLQLRRNGSTEMRTITDFGVLFECVR